MSGYVDNYNELVKVANDKFEELIEADSSTFFEKLHAKNYAKYLARYYYNKSLSSVYENKIIVVPKNGYITQRMVYINPSLTGGTKVGVQAVNITEQDGSIQLSDSGAVSFCSLRRFFDSLCYAFGIKVDYSKVDVFSLCDSVLANFEFIYNRETGHRIYIDNVNFDNVYVLYIVEDEKTYFDEDLVQAFANKMYEAKWFDYSTLVNIDVDDLEVGDIIEYKSSKPSFEFIRKICIETDNLIDRLKSGYDKTSSHALKLWQGLLAEGFDFNNYNFFTISLYSNATNDRSGRIRFELTCANVDLSNITVQTKVTKNGLTYCTFPYLTVTNGYVGIVSEYCPANSVDNKYVHYHDISSGTQTIYNTWIGFSPDTSSYLTGIKTTTVLLEEKTAPYVDGITVIDGAKIPTNIDSLSTDYPTWFSRLKNIVGTAVESAGEALRNTFKVIEFVPLTLLGGDLNPTQDEVHTGEVLLPNLVPTLPEYTVKYLTPLPKDDEPIAPDEPYVPPTTPTPSPTTPPAIGGITPPTPDAPVMTSGNGLFTVYNPTQEQLNAFGGYLWGEDIVGILQSIFQNPMQAIISLHVIYATPETGEEIPIRLGYMTSTVNAKEVTSQYIQIDCGTVDVPEYYGSALDYAPYTKAHIYLPFIGMRELNVNEIMGTQVNVKYSIDVLTGTVYASISVFHNALSQVLYTFEGNCAVQLPLTGGDVSRLLSGMITGIALGASRGGIAGAVIGTATGAMASGGLSVSKSGSIGANAGAMGIKKPYIIITHNQPYMANNYNKQHGYPANISVQLSSCKGYTRVKDVHVENISVATQEEKKLIETLLKQGIVIN